MIVQRMKLGALQDPDKFVEFMRDRFLPAMRGDATRIGQASYIELLQGSTQETLDEFVLFIDGLMHFHPASRATSWRRSSTFLASRWRVLAACRRDVVGAG